MYTLFINSVIKNFTVLLLDQNNNLIDSNGCEDSKLFSKICAEFFFKHKDANINRIIYVNGPGLFNNLRSGYLACKAAALKFNIKNIESISSLDLLESVGLPAKISASKITDYVKINGKTIELEKDKKEEKKIFTLDILNNFDKLKFKTLTEIEYGKEPNIQKTSPAYIVLSLTLILIMISVPISIYLSNLNTQTNRIIKNSLDFEVAKSEGQLRLKEILSEFDSGTDLNNQSEAISDQMTLHYDIHSIVNEQISENLYISPFMGSGNAGENCKPFSKNITTSDPCNFHKLSSDQTLIYNIPQGFSLPQSIVTSEQFSDSPLDALLIEGNKVSKLSLTADVNDNAKFNITSNNVLSENINRALVLKMKSEFVKLKNDTLSNSLNLQFQSDKALPYIQQIATGYIEFSNSKQKIFLSQERKAIENNSELGILVSN